MAQWIRRPSPAMIVALVALVVSVGGNVTAAVMITSAGIQDNTIRSVDIRDETLKSVDIASGAVTGADVANNSLTGADVNESTLARVPSAASAANAQDAGRVDGLDANALTRVARMGAGTPLVLAVAEQTFGTALSITAPRAGFVMISGATTFFNEGCSSLCTVAAKVRHIQGDSTSAVAQESLPPGQFFSNLAHAWVFPVNAGANTFDIRLWRGLGNGTLSGFNAELAAVYSPFGRTGARTLATSEQAASAQPSD